MTMQSARTVVALVMVALLSACNSRSPTLESRSEEQPATKTPQNATLSDNEIFTEPFPSDGVVLGQGWNSLAGRPTPYVCVGGTELKTQGGSVTADYRYISDREQFEKTLNISAGGSYSGVGYGASVSANFSSFNSSDKSKTYILGRVLSDKGTEFLIGKDKKLDLVADQKNLSDAEFFQRCGDSYVSSIKLGGTLGILFTLDQSTSTTSQSMGLTVSASGFGASANLSLSQKTMDTLSKNDVQVRQYQSAGTLDTPTNASDAIAKISHYATYDPSAAVPYQVTLMPYALVDIKVKSAAASNLFYLKAMFWEYQRLMELTALYNAAVISPSDFYIPFYKDGNSLTEQAAILTATTKCLEPLLALCRDYGECGFDKLSSENVKRYRATEICPLNGNELTAEEKGVVIGLVTLNVFSRKKMVEVYGGSENKSNKLDANSPMMLVLPNDVSRSFNTAMDATPPASSATPAAPAEQNVSGATPANFPSAADKLATFDFYYQLLAKAPLHRVVTVDKGVITQQQGDELAAAIALCSVRNVSGGCPTYDDFTSGPNEVASNALGAWVLLTRLSPLSQTFCAETLSHPMCKSPGELVQWTPTPQSQSVWFGPDHGFMPSAKPPQPGNGDHTPPAHKPPPSFRACPGPAANSSCL
ncbi:hypothetical protein [Caballeronia sordidicola]|uniref:hypothetical protein n=1 Tax=Caballeronia sordidicola TaxID=196367 RepID=UPI001269FB3C|nr:hypothetical protein [Caballeronia sordidicola]